MTISDYIFLIVLALIFIARLFFDEKIIKQQKELMKIKDRRLEYQSKQLEYLKEMLRARLLVEQSITLLQTVNNRNINEEIIELEKKLSEAIKDENYERAIFLRDEIIKLNNQKKDIE